MKSRILIYTLIAFFAIGCTDPCDDPINLECETGDADGDGIINIEDPGPTDPCTPDDNIACLSGDLDNDGITNELDSDPFERCIPSVPTPALNIIGTWSWGNFRKIEFLEDGTYIDIENQFIFFQNGADIIVRQWRIQSANTLVLAITNMFGGISQPEYPIKSNECNEFTIEHQGLDLKFSRF